MPVPRIPGTPATITLQDNDSNSSPRYRRVPITKDDLIRELQEVQHKHPGTKITYALYKFHGGNYHFCTFRSYFGSWAKAVRAAGGIPGHTRYSQDEMFDEMQRVWEQLGRQPTFAEMEMHGKISPGTYDNRFGSWIKSVHAFCEDRNSDTDPKESRESSILASTNDDVVKSDSPDTIPTVEPIPFAKPSPSVIWRKTPRAVGKRLRFCLLSRDNFTCQACGRSCSKHGVALEVDHIVAYTKGGETVLENLQALCEDCNVGKSNL